MPHYPDDDFSNWMEVAQDKRLQIIIQLRRQGHKALRTHIHIPAHTINRSRGSVGKKKKGIITAKWYEENLSAAELDLFDSWCNWWWFDFGLVWMASYGGGSLLKTSQRTFSFSFLILLTQLWNAPSSRLVAAAARQEVGRSPTHGATWSRPDQAADDAPSKGL